MNLLLWGVGVGLPPGSSRRPGRVLPEFLSAHGRTGIARRSLRTEGTGITQGGRRGGGVTRAQGGEIGFEPRYLVSGVGVHSFARKSFGRLKHRL